MGIFRADAHISRCTMLTYSRSNWSGTVYRLMLALLLALVAVLLSKNTASEQATVSSAHIEEGLEATVVFDV
jgi:hypothetical protein